MGMLSASWLNLHITTKHKTSDRSVAADTIEHVSAGAQTGLMRRYDKRGCAAPRRQSLQPSKTITQ